ncbi:MAG: hypothetical protein IJ060_08705 [Oscillospiraceae bacterium]|nr:hypothetical protein [Oscillospiraceae bacterium]
MHLTLNVLLSLLIQAKRQGQGKIGNGKMLVMLLQIIADTDDPEQTQKRNLLRIFTDEPVKSLAYQKIDKQLVKFIPSGKPYPYEALHFTRFEHAIGNLPAFGFYLMRMNRCCQELIDPDKAESLAYTLLKILRADTAFSDVLYGERYLPKAALFGSPAHPVKLCLPALLLGLMYQMHLSPHTGGAPVKLMQAPLLLHFYLVNPAGSYRDRTEALRDLLNPDEPIPMEQSISQTAAKLNITKNKDYYPVELRSRSGQFTSLPESGDVFLYGTGGIGKSTILNRLKATQTAFILPLYSYHPQYIRAYQPNRSVWILLQILLKYYYQNSYMAYESCAANEGEEAVLRALHELHGLFARTPLNAQFSYTLMLDGINEIPPDYQSDYMNEIEHICTNWRNVRLIVTGRNVPPNPVFSTFCQIELCGITDEFLDTLLPASIGQRSKILLKTPLFLEIYDTANLDRITLNRARLIDAYVNRLIEQVHDKSVQPLLRFLTLYVLPVAANHAAKHQQMMLERADLADAVSRAIEVYIEDERIYQNLLYPQNITKRSLPIGSGKDELIDFLVSHICLIQTDASDPKMLCFSHQYFRDYYAAKHIVNLLNALQTGYQNDLKQLEELFYKYGLAHIWYPEEMKDIYCLIGELAGDDSNQAEADFCCQETILDTVLDWSRQFDTFRVTENIIRTMAAVRNNIICGVNFSGTNLPLYLPCNLKFSLNGEYACDFIRCHVNLIGLIDGNICCTAKSADNTKMLLALEDQYVILFDSVSKTVLHEYDFSDGNMPWCTFDTAAFSPDNRFAFLMTDNAAILLNADSGTVMYQYINVKEHCIVDFAAFSHDSRYWVIRVQEHITLIDLIAECEIQPEKPLADYGISDLDKYTLALAETRTVSELEPELLRELYRNLTHFQGCDFTGSTFLSDDTKHWLPVMI